MMKIPARIRFFNVFRSVFKIPPLEKALAFVTKNKGYNHFFVKCIPQNYQYPKGSFRIAVRNGIRFRLDVSEYMEWVIYFGLNVEDRKSLYPLVKPGMSVMDIGTNIGETVLNFAAIAGKNGIIYGFEPVAVNYRKCLDNISLNSFSNIQVQQTALSDKNEILYFGASDNLNSGGIFMNKEKGKTAESIKAITLDEFVSEKGITKMDLIKIDVEGFEWNVLKGASDTCKRLKPLLFVEVDDVNLGRQGKSAALLELLIRSYGYSVRKASKDPAPLNHPAHYDIICEPV